MPSVQAHLAPAITLTPSGVFDGALARLSTLPPLTLGMHVLPARGQVESRFRELERNRTLVREFAPACGPRDVLVLTYAIRVRAAGVPPRAFAPAIEVACTRDAQAASDFLNACVFMQWAPGRVHRSGSGSWQALMPPSRTTDAEIKALVESGAVVRVVRGAELLGTDTKE